MMNTPPKKACFVRYWWGFYFLLANYKQLLVFHRKHLQIIV